MKNVSMMLASLVLGVVAMTHGPQDQTAPEPTAVVEFEPSQVLSRYETLDGSIYTVKSRGNSIAKLAQEMKNASREKKAEIESRIRSELEQQYEEFLQQNEAQIEQLQSRIDRLNDQLKRRRSAMSKMVQLEFDRIVNESEGLVWPNRGRSSYLGRREHLFRDPRTSAGPFDQRNDGYTPRPSILRDEGLDNRGQQPSGFNQRSMK